MVDDPVMPHVESWGQVGSEVGEFCLRKIKMFSYQTLFDQTMPIQTSLLSLNIKNKQLGNGTRPGVSALVPP